MKYLSVLCLLIIAGYAYSATIRTVDCGSHAHIQSAVLTPCAQEPCMIQAGASYTLTVKFESREYFSDATTSLQGKHGFITYPFPVSDVSACGAEVQCPLRPGPTYTYNSTFTTPASLTNAHFAMKLRLSDVNSDKDIFCFVFTAEIV